ncbi:MAG: folylpolyglutamate synthase/dihydrofolate synthase family protein [Candidatus Omnitrophota bacterium]|nr:folylpolyglutamate synthase/dihydrofolate synthase family protein [Candidatus Omnitrophota bacterium]
MLSFPEAIRYLESFVNYEKKSQYHYKRLIKLERIKELLEILGNPQGAFKCIHVAGTKGKGSTCAFCAYILREAGYKTGLYTSPHLSDFRERIRILLPSPEPRAPSPEFEGMIPRRALCRLVSELKPKTDKFNKNSKYGSLTFFEVYTALSFVYFKEKKADFVVLETGLGGRLDATNVVNPLVCAITPISLEHTQLLGNTIEKIAREKAGIIKNFRLSSFVPRPSVVISAPQEEGAAEVIRNRCRQVGAKLYEVGKDIIYKVKSQKSKVKNKYKISKFEIRGIFSEYKNLRIKLLGKHQLVNAATAVGVVEALRFNGVNISVDSIRKGIYNTVWPGRCEVVSKNPWIILDGAQNAASAKALKETIKHNFSAEGGSASGGQYKRLILVLGVCQDKDIEGICSEFFPMADEVILTKANSPRAAEAEHIKLQAASCKLQAEIYLTKDVREAIEKAKEIADRKDLILVTGSLFVVGEARQAINNGSFYSPH